MNHTEEPTHTAHEHPFVFAQKTDKFWFVMSCLLTIRIRFVKPSTFMDVWFANHNGNHMQMVSFASVCDRPLEGSNASLLRGSCISLLQGSYVSSFQGNNVT